MYLETRAMIILARCQIAGLVVLRSQERANPYARVNEVRYVLKPAILQQSPSMGTVKAEDKRNGDIYYLWYCHGNCPLIHKRYARPMQQTNANQCIQRP